MLTRNVWRNFFMNVFFFIDVLKELLALIRFRCLQSDSFLFQFMIKHETNL